MKTLLKLILAVTLSLALAACGGPSGPADPGGPDNGGEPSPFVGVWFGYYTNTALLYMEFDDTGWKLGFGTDPVSARQGSYTFSGDTALIARNERQSGGTVSISGDSATVNFTELGRDWDPFTLTKRGSSGASGNGKLSSIRVIEQPPGSPYCAVACTKMIEEFYFGESNSWEYLWDKLTHGHGTTATGVGMTSVGFYLETRGLYSSVVLFSDLQAILNYLQTSQTPAVMHIRNNGILATHAILFAGYDSATGYVTVCDPSSSERIRIHYNDLLILFDYYQEDYKDNQIVIVSSRLDNGVEFACDNCGRITVVENAIIPAIDYLDCICASSIAVR